MTAEVELWTWPTPNGRKITIMLEECALPYEVHAVNIREGAQLEPAFRALNPNTKIPVIRDNAPKDGGAPLVLTESGAILEYLAERTGRFGGATWREAWHVRQWLMFQMGGLGPMHGQANHFCAYTAEPHPYSRERYRNEAIRLYRVADAQLGRAEWLAGDDYSIADMAAFPWSQQMDRIEVDMTDFPNLSRWSAAMLARPAVQAGMGVLAELTSPARMTEAEREIMFGTRQHARPDSP